MGRGVCLPTQCRRCGVRDSPSHLLEHMRMSRLPTEPEEIIEFLKKLANEANAANPHMSVPLLPETSCDFELYSEDSEIGGSLASLSFENDELTSG